MKKKRFLCVEDHPDTCELIATILDEFEVISAGSKAEALRKAATLKFNLYLLDYHLPDGTGMELALLIRNFDPETPILFVTGTSSLTEKQAIKIGAQGVIKKSSKTFVEDLTNKAQELLKVE